MKRLIVCFDGTWNSADSGGAETNVPRIARAVSASSLGEGTPQLTLYLREVGSTGIALQRVLGGITGEGVDDNIRSAYMFLAQNYVPRAADRRTRRKALRRRLHLHLRVYPGGLHGAEPVRLHRLHRSAQAPVPRTAEDAWKYYRSGNRRNSRDFCRRSGADCHHDAQIDFLGVWDTVGALGVPVGVLGGFTAPEYEFHDTEPSASVLRACHALAIDEHRDEFVPTLWTGEEPEGSTVEQVWFAGAHSDVGGGYAERRLADIPLVWMAERAEGSKLVLDWTMLPKADGLVPLSPQHDSRQGWSIKDRLTPTYRRLGEIDCDVGLMARLYVPREGGHELPTVNESVHPSVWERHGRTVERIRGPERDDREDFRYDPLNLTSRDRFD